MLNLLKHSNMNSLETVMNLLEDVHYPCGPVYRSIERKKAYLLLNDGNETEAIYHLSESHAPNLRCNAALQFDKISNSETKDKLNVINKQYIDFTCNHTHMDKNVDCMLQEVSEMPKEWTIIQLTSKFSVSELNITNSKLDTNPIHISVFNCGMPDCKPFCVTVKAPEGSVDGKTIEICEEMNDIIKCNKTVLKSAGSLKSFTSNKDRKAYRDARENLNCRLRRLVKDIQDIWLGEWRCLFIGKYVAEEVEKKLTYKVEEFLKKENITVTEKIKNILRCLVKGCSYLTLNELRKGIKYCFHNCSTNIQQLVFNFIRKCSDELCLHELKRHPVILIIDEKLDFIPWEMIDVNRNHPISRMPSLKFTYALFKEHENTIEKGLKVGINYKNGGYIINPDSDLAGLQTRLHSFMNYWTDWNGLVGTKPSETEFEDFLKTRDIFCYSGHGSGSQYLSGEKIQKMRVHSVVLLFGCSSVELTSYGPRVEMSGQYYMYLIGCSPCIVGMLWTVTDTDTDLVTTEFLSQWIPSVAPTHWKYIDKMQWNSGEIVANKNIKIAHVTGENELLRALCKARKAAVNYITAAAAVARGLPVKINFT